jgi:hypothetical protein
LAVFLHLVTCCFKTYFTLVCNVFAIFDYYLKRKTLIEEHECAIESGRKCFVDNNLLGAALLALNLAPRIFKLSLPYLVES